MTLAVTLAARPGNVGATLAVTLAARPGNVGATLAVALAGLAGRHPSPAKKGAYLMPIPVPEPTLAILTMPSTDTQPAWYVEVVRNAQTGNVSAFNTLFQYYNLRICTYLARMVGNDEEGRDLAQETFIKVWRALPGMHETSQFDTWLYRIATNTAIDYLRRRKSRWPLWRSTETYEATEQMSIAGPEEQIEEAELIKLALAELSPPYRASLLLQHVAGLSQREIAKSLNLSEKSVSIYVSRGCEQFRKAYERLVNGREATCRRLHS